MPTPEYITLILFYEYILPSTINQDNQIEIGASNFRINKNYLISSEESWVRNQLLNIDPVLADIS